MTSIRTPLMLLLVLLVSIDLPSPGSSTSITPQASPDFSLAVLPPTMNISPGFSSNVTLHLTSIAGFSGHLYFSTKVQNWTFYTQINGLISPQGFPLTPFLPANGSVNVTLTVINQTYGLSGCCHTLTINATSNGISHAENLTATVVPTPYAVFPDQSPGVINAGSSTTLGVTVSNIILGAAAVIVGASNSVLMTPFAGTVELSAHSSPGPFEPKVSIKPSQVSLSAQNTVAHVSLNITCSQSVTPGTHIVIVSGAFGSEWTSSTLGVQVQLAGPYYNITMNSSSLVLQGGSPQTANVTVTSVNGFTGTVTGGLDPTGPYFPSAPIEFLGSSPPSVNLEQGQSKQIALSFVSLSGCRAAGPSYYTFTGNNGTMMRTINFSVSSSLYPDFFFTPPGIGDGNPFPTFGVEPGSTWKGNFSLASCNGFAGPVTLRLNPSSSKGTWNFWNDVNVTVNQTMVNLSPGTLSTSTISVKARSDAFVGGGWINTTATSGGLVRWGGPRVDILAELNLTSASIISINQGSTGTANINLNANFDGSFNITVDAPLGITAQSDPGIAHLAQGVRTAPLTLTASASSTLKTGHYNITVSTTVHGGLFGLDYPAMVRRSVVIPVIVMAGNSNLQLSPLLIVGGSVGATLAALALAFAALRRRRRPEPDSGP